MPPAPSYGIVAAGVQCFHVVMGNLRHVNFPAGQIMQCAGKFFGGKKQVFSFVLIDKDAIGRFFLIQRIQPEIVFLQTEGSESF